MLSFFSILSLFENFVEFFEINKSVLGGLLLNLFIDEIFGLKPNF